MNFSCFFLFRCLSVRSAEVSILSTASRDRLSTGNYLSACAGCVSCHLPLLSRPPSSPFYHPMFRPSWPPPIFFLPHPRALFPPIFIPPSAPFSAPISRVEPVVHFNKQLYNLTDVPQRFLVEYLHISVVLFHCLYFSGTPVMTMRMPDLLLSGAPFNETRMAWRVKVL